MSVINIDLEDGLEPVSFSLKINDQERFMEFMNNYHLVEQQLTSAQNKADYFEQSHLMTLKELNVLHDIIFKRDKTIATLLDALEEAAGVIDDLNRYFEDVHKLDAKIPAEYRNLISEIRSK